MFEVGRYYRVTYRNKDYVKTLHCRVLSFDDYCIQIIDKFKNIVIIGRGSIIESSPITKEEVE